MLLLQLFLLALQFIEALFGHVHVGRMAHFLGRMLAGLWEVAARVKALGPEVLREKFMAILGWSTGKKKYGVMDGIQWCNEISYIST